MAQPVLDLFTEEGEEIFIENLSPLEELGKDAPFDYDEDSPNLVEDFAANPAGREALRIIADEVMTNYENAAESTEQYRERLARDWKMFAGELPPKDFPFEGAANAHIPMTLENISRVYFRVMGELFADWNNVFGVSPVGPEDQAQAELLSLHGNWQIREQIPSFVREQHRGVLMFFMHGDVTSHSWYDFQSQTNRHEILSCDEFVVPYALTSTAPDWSDVPYVVKILSKYRNEIEAMEGHWYKVDRIFSAEPSWEDEPVGELHQTANSIMGLDPPTGDKFAPYKLLHYEGWMTLPNQERQRFVQVVMEYSKKIILKLAIHEAPDWRERIRYNQQLEELSLYTQQRDEFYAKQRAEGDMRAQTQAGLAIGEAPGPQEIAMGAAGMDRAPVEPDWYTEGQGPPPMKRHPIRMFAHAVCIEPLAGNRGLSYGKIEAELNRGVDTLLSQYIDAGTLANSKTILTSGNITFPDDFRISPGGHTQIKGASSREFKDGIMPLDFGPANGQLMEVTNLLMQYGQSAIQAPDVLSGVAGKSGETYRGIAARIEQATKQLSVATQKYATPFLTQILKNNAKLNAIFMDEVEFFTVTDHIQQMAQTRAIGRVAYERDYRVEIRADLRFVPQAQKIAEADELVAITQQPQMQGNIPFVHRALVKAMKARGQEDMIPYLGPPPPPPETPLGIPPPPPGSPPGAPPEGGGPPPPPQ